MDFIIDNYTGIMFFGYIVTIGLLFTFAIYNKYF